MKKLKEVILRQEGTINALKCAEGGKRGGGGGGGAANDPTRRSKSPSGGHAGALRAQTLRNGSSKQNTLQQKSKSKAPPPRRKSTSAHDSPKNTQGEEPVEYPPSALEEVDERTNAPTEEEEEEPTEHWLQRHLSKLIVANNNLGAKLVDGRHERDSSCVGGERHHNATIDGVDPPHGKQQRKPYNAADYGGTSRDHFPAQSHSGTINHHSNPTVPSLVTSIAPNPSHHATASPEEVGAQSSKNRIITYKNGTTKEVSPDGTMTISFPNGDRKRTYANEKKGVIVYYYASTKVRCKVCFAV